MKCKVLWLMFTLVVLSVAVQAQTLAHIERADSFLSAVLNNQYSTVEQLSHERLAKQLDSTKLVQILEQIYGAYGEFSSQWMVSAEKQKGFIEVIYNTHFKNDSCSFRIVMDEEGKVMGFWVNPVHKKLSFNPPPYADQSKFDEVQVTIGDENWPLPGTLSLPKGKGPHPVVILIHGSGPHDRDETVKKNKPFRDIAFGLATQGIAVLRYDKRTYVHADKLSGGITAREEVLDDVAAAVAFVHQSEEVDQNAIFLLGHSLGGMLAPVAAKENEEVAGIIMLAAPAHGFAETALRQIRYLKSLPDSLGGSSGPSVDAMIQTGEKIVEGTADKSTAFLGANAGYYYNLDEQQHLETARSLTIPIFIGHAENDYQVVDEDYELWKEALASNDDAKFKSYEGLFHLFIPSTGIPSPSDYEIEGNVSNTLISDLAEWIHKHGK
ncbi:MAG: hypothetical protein CL946_07875 [Ectothiorhodospiraceae bacterium]|nr:hypothetical protein [Ectothiorhodospiraceae bacterium]